MEKSHPCTRRSNRGAWTALEDKLLRDYVKTHGPGKWRNVSQETGLERSGKSCRLRWLNYLRPDIKRGNISPEEEDLIIRLHKLLGNRWSLIAGRLPGRSDNEIKNYWNTTLAKRVVHGQNSNQSKDDRKEKEKEPSNMDEAPMEMKGSEGPDPVNDFKEDYSPNPAMDFSGKLFQYNDTDYDQLWNFSDFDDGRWGCGNMGGANGLCQWSDFPSASAEEAEIFFHS
ncbi:unnamed protein product, partial [Vitis vinifera]